MTLHHLFILTDVLDLSPMNLVGLAAYLQPVFAHNRGNELKRLFSDGLDTEVNTNIVSYKKIGQLSDHQAHLFVQDVVARLLRSMNTPLSFATSGQELKPTWKIHKPVEEEFIFNFDGKTTNLILKPGVFPKSHSEITFSDKWKFLPYFQDRNKQFFRTWDISTSENTLSLARDSIVICSWGDYQVMIAHRNILSPESTKTGDDHTLI
jgi:hypothetical protein